MSQPLVALLVAATALTTYVPQTRAERVHHVLQPARMLRHFRPKQIVRSVLIDLDKRVAVLASPLTKSLAKHLPRLEPQVGQDGWVYGGTSAEHPWPKRMRRAQEQSLNGQWWWVDPQRQAGKRLIGGSRLTQLYQQQRARLLHLEQQLERQLKWLEQQHRRQKQMLLLSPEQQRKLHDYVLHTNAKWQVQQYQKLGPGRLFPQR